MILYFHLLRTPLAPASLTLPPASPPTLKANGGWSRRGQAFKVVSFAGEHRALGHP